MLQSSTADLPQLKLVSISVDPLHPMAVEVTRWLLMHRPTGARGAEVN